MKIKLSKVQYLRDEVIKLQVDAVKRIEGSYIEIKICRLDKEIFIKKYGSWEKDKYIELEKFNFEEKAVGLKIIVSLFENHSLLDQQQIITDVVDNPWVTPRYGFVSNFRKEEEEIKEIVETLSNYHLTVIQFYDWMYRHHELVTQSDYYKDAMGKEISKESIKEYIKHFKKKGMNSFGYAAVYGAQPEFYNHHKDWMLYDSDGAPLKFLPQIGYMDINSESPWRAHIIEEFCKAVDFGFNGLHLDAYGFPKKALNGTLEKVRDLRKDFPSFINSLSKTLSERQREAGLVFNNVNDWPIDTVSKAKGNFNYIEVWAPHDTFHDLYDLITKAKSLSPEKQVVLAAYMHPFLDMNENTNDKDYQAAERAMLYTMATIFASGGFHLALGEKNHVLTQAYYSDNTKLRKKFINDLQNYYDFFVQFEELLIDLSIIDDTLTATDGINEEVVFSGAPCSSKAEQGKIWTLVKEVDDKKIIHLINFSSNKHMNWNEAHFNEINAIKELEVEIQTTAQKVKGIYIGTPDSENVGLSEVPFQIIHGERGGKIRFKVDNLKIWSMVYVQY